jgi:hypothetical protein
LSQQGVQGADLLLSPTSPLPTRPLHRHQLANSGTSSADENSSSEDDDEFLEAYPTKKAATEKSYKTNKDEEELM